MTIDTNGQATVFIRYAGWIYELSVNNETGQTARSSDGLIATCRPNGIADIEKYDLRSGVKIFDGMGSWCTTKPIERDPDTIKIKIKRGSKIQSTETYRWRTIDETITVFAHCDDENGEYVFKRDGKEWSIGYENADQA